MANQNEKSWRIAQLTMTSTEWTSETTVLLKGEFAVESDTGLFKIGDGVNVYSALAYATPTQLAELLDDATHRLCTDDEKATWNGKADVSIVPTKTGQLTNNGNGTGEEDDYFITKAEADEHYTAGLTYKGHCKTLDDLPTDAKDGDFYYVESELAFYLYDGDHWDATGSLADLSEYVKKSELATVATSGKAEDLTTDSTHKFVSEEDIANWNAKQDALTIETTPKKGSTNPISSGAVYDIQQEVDNAIKYDDEVIIVCEL